ncbi:MAG: LysE family transporter [Patescibacteria group bacterium]
MTIHFFAWLTPGPLFVLIVRNSVIYSRKTGFWTAAGIALGNLIHVTYSVTGIALIISNSNFLFNIIKYLGVVYLTYLGVKTLQLNIVSKKSESKEKQKDISRFSAFKTGFLTNILSPKASLFFASIFASVFAASAPIWVIIFLVIIMPLNSLFMASLLSIFFTQNRVLLIYNKYQNLINKSLGGALILLALLILLF